MQVTYKLGYIQVVTFGYACNVKKIGIHGQYV